MKIAERYEALSYVCEEVASYCDLAIDHHLTPEERDAYRWMAGKLRAEALEWTRLAIENDPKPEPRCTHDRLNLDGICRSCGADCRGIQ